MDAADLIALMNDPLVRRFMPLLRGDFTATDAHSLVAGKEALWSAHGYGPWAFFIDQRFAGWGACSPNQATRTWVWCCVRSSGVGAAMFTTRSSGSRSPGRVVSP